MESLRRADFLTPKEAAEMMMCSQGHVRNLVARRVLPFYRISIYVYIPKEAVEKHIRDHTFPALTQEN